MKRNVTSIARVASLVPAIIGPENLNEVYRECRMLKKSELDVSESTDD